MSRHYTSKTPLEIVVGWDPPLQTFFLQILDHTKDGENEFVLWRGTYPDELPTIESLAAVLTPYAALTEELVKDLEAEKTASTKPSPLQLRVIEMFSPNKS